MLLLHEALRDDGSRARIFLAREADGALALVDDEGTHALPEGALSAVMRRYGKELEGDIPEHGESLALADGARVVRFRYKSVFDVIGRDYVAYAEPGAAPLCELATAVSAALVHLSRVSRVSSDAAAPAKST